MISILIPVYNRDVTALVTDLLVQCARANIPFEILIVDDASPDESIRGRNALLERLGHVRYHSLTENSGVQRVRQTMARMALYPQLLLIDSDAEIAGNKDFFSRYVPLADGVQVVFGGIAYAGQHRNNLRWWYGVNREAYSAQQLNRMPYNFVSTFNLLLPKDVLLDLTVPADMKGYGHEDTFLRLALENKGIPIRHIDNALVHNGLCTNLVFLKETEKGVQSLWSLYRHFEPAALIRRRSRLVRTYVRLKRTGFQRIFHTWFTANESHLRRNLLSERPSLRKMDLFKLGKFIQYSLGKGE